MTLPPRPEPYLLISNGVAVDCDSVFYEELLTEAEPVFNEAQLRARELEIIEACKAVCEEIDCKKRETIPYGGTLIGWLQMDCIAAIDKLKDEL